MPETLPPVDARRYRPDTLVLFAIALLEAAGLPADRARAVAEILVEGDLLGHTTHGLDMLALYLKEIEQGTMATTGEPHVINDMGAALTWDGNKLPGPWLVRKAIAETRSRILAHPVVTVVMRRSHHIGCLQAYLKSITDAGLRRPAADVRSGWRGRRAAWRRRLAHHAESAGDGLPHRARSQRHPVPAIPIRC